MHEPGNAWPIDAIRVSKRLLNVPAAGVLAVLALLAISVIRHPASLQSARSLLWIDAGLLLACGIAAACVQFQASAALHAAISLGTRAGFVLAAILIANHVTELFVPDRDFAAVIAPVLLAFALLSPTGSVAGERTRSLPLAVLAGVWAALVGTLLLICAGCILNLTMEARVELWLRGAFVASAMKDPGAFLVQNTLQAASEGLVRMPVLAVILSLLGASANALLSRWPRTAIVLAAGLVPCLLAGGTAILGYVNSLPRTARPPWVLAGALLVCFGVSAAHPVWSVLRRRLAGP